MSAAPPAPPHLYSVNPTRHEPKHSNAGARDFGDDGKDGRNGVASPHKTIPHIRDLVYEAESRVDIHQPVKRLLDLADSSFKQARTFVDFRKPDRAYAEYLLATHIVSTIIPKHKDYPALRSDQHVQGHLWRELVKRLNTESARFDGIKDVIILDNQRSGVQPTRGPYTSRESASTLTSYTTSELYSDGDYFSNPPPGLKYGKDVHTRRTSITQGRDNPSSDYRVVTTKARPPVHPKPQSLQTASISDIKPSSRASESDSLSERFAKLRGASTHEEPEVKRLARSNSKNGVTTSSISNSTFVSDRHLPTTVSNGQDYAPTVGRSPAAQWFVATDARNLHGLPKPPSPTYSPVRSSQSGTPLQPPRSTRAQAESSISRPSSSDSTVANRSSIQARIGTSNGSNDAVHDAPIRTESTRPRPPQKRRKSINLPQETEIDAHRLYDYLKSFDILLLDVRDRVQYDSGHIWAQSVVCVDPTAVRPNMSASELQDSLVLSPEIEQAMFDRRDQYDLVVYYDQSSKTRSFLQGRGNLGLKCVHDALYDYNHDKPLRYPPVLLVGGVDAWVDLMGSHALVTSRTAEIRQPIRPQRPLARVPLPSNVSTLSIQKRRFRDYNPLDADEERKWRERVRSDSYVLDTQAQSEEQDEGDFQSSASHARTYDDFHRRFPDVAAVEEHSSLPTPRYGTPPIPRIPRYPTPPPLTISTVPDVPSRPPPAVPRRSYSGVSERVSSPSPLSRTPQLAPYIPSKLLRLPRTGLHNFGVTCYMNSTIQCLSATLPLTAFFMDQVYMKYVQKENWKGSKGLMCELYHTLLRNLWDARGALTIRPTNLRKFCARLNKEWGIDRQQDAKEFLEFLVDTLHEDLNVNWNRTPLRPLTDAEEAQRERTPPFVAAKREWDRYLHRDHSRLTDLFAGQHISRLQCTTCGHSSTTYEPFYSISVEIPGSPASGSPVDIRDCLRSYCSAETLRGDEVWRCPRCRTEREATKRITICRAPEFLIVHLKRFSAGQGERARKIHTPVDFPLHDLDLGPFMLDSPTSSECSAAARTYGQQELELPQAMAPPFRYDAYAVMRHLGSTMTSGHYIALVQDKVRGCWREFNDEKVTDFKPQELPTAKRLQNEQAYIVFYQRVRE